MNTIDRNRPPDKHKVKWKDPYHETREDELSPGELRQLWHLVGMGNTTEDVADEMGISVRMVLSVKRLSVNECPRCHGTGFAPMPGKTDEPGDNREVACWVCEGDT